MPVAAPGEGYLKMIAYGRHKAELRWDQLVLQSLAAGVWVAIYGHACTVFASQFFNGADPYSAGYTKIAYGFLFPGAFIAVIYTGTELFTGNTVTMFMLLFNDGKKVLPDLFRIWSISLAGNLTGAVFGAFIITWCSGVFPNGSRAQEFLFSLAHKKNSQGFINNIILGIGCNALVCLATWCVVISDDGAGKALAVFYTVGVFVMGGYEHIVANFYTMSAAHMVGFSEYSFGGTLWRNWLPVLIGNVLAGTLFTGVLWWYALHPHYSDLAPYTNQELATELTKRLAPTSDTSKEEPGLRWERSKPPVAASFTTGPQAQRKNSLLGDYSSYMLSQSVEQRSSG